MKIFLHHIEKLDKNGNGCRCFIRELEMTVEHATGPAMQFFYDCRVYGLNEAILYAKGYEKEGYFEVGTEKELLKVAKRIAVAIHA